MLVYACKGHTKRYALDLKKQYTKIIEKLPRSQQRPFVPPPPVPAEHARFALFMDSTLVGFYTTDLTFTLSEDDLPPNDDSIACGREMAKMS